MDFFKNLINDAKQKPIRTVAVAVAQDEDVLSAVDYARKIGIVNAILVGDEVKIKEICSEKNIDTNNYQIIHEEDITLASKLAVKLVKEGNAHILMKGLVDTSIILKAVLSSADGLKVPGNLISHVALFHVKNHKKPYLVTDAAMNIAPTLEEKVKIIHNAVNAMEKIGVKMPRVAALCAKEKVSDKMPATVDAGILQKMWEDGLFPNCIVGGPLALDVAISKESCLHKGLVSPVDGEADILLAPDIEAGNILYKSLSYFSESQGAGLILGASAPIVLTSRSDDDDTKLNSILLAAVIS